MWAPSEGTATTPSGQPTTVTSDALGIGGGSLRTSASAIRARVGPRSRADPRPTLSGVIRPPRLTSASSSADPRDGTRVTTTVRPGATSTSRLLDRGSGPGPGPGRAGSTAANGATGKVSGTVRRAAVSTLSPRLTSTSASTERTGTREADSATSTVATLARSAIGLPSATARSRSSPRTGPARSPPPMASFAPPERRSSRSASPSRTSRSPTRIGRSRTSTTRGASPSPRRVRRTARAVSRGAGVISAS